MLARQRQERILEEVRAHGGVRVADLVDLLDVSDMTVRRDIAALDRRGLVARVHGGATSIGNRSGVEPPASAKAALARAEKESIARAVAALVEPGESVAISAGTTTLAVARELLAVEDLTVVTNSVPVADLMHDPARHDRTVILVGGQRTPSDALVGPVAVAALRSLHVDTLVLGCHGIAPDVGLTTPNVEEAETDRALLQSARRLVVAADHTKWGVVGLAGFAALEEIDVLVTDRGLARSAQRVLSRSVGRLVVADDDELVPAAPDPDPRDDVAAPVEEVG
ncbi:DeoR/GlpR family DNA-binding transcription regulator [Angustibacter aerolatus]